MKSGVGRGGGVGSEEGGRKGGAYPILRGLSLTKA